MRRSTGDWRRSAPTSRPAIAAAYDWTGVTSVVDVGAGAGALLASIVDGNPGVRGILFDRPDVLPDSDHLLTARGVRQRCELVGGSFFEPMQVEGDVWMLSQVLHDWPDAECQTILRAVQRTDANR